MKNKKTKYYLKNNLIGLIIGGIIFGSLGVYAAITFPSNEVSFDPSNSTLTSTNVKDAIDELYKKCTDPQTSDQIIEDAGLEKDPYECRYFFTGATPNNYITFNDEPAGWRIISVECDGTIKIMRNNNIGRYKWDNSNIKNWANPTTLNTYLNSTYYNGLNSTAQSQIVAKDWSIGAVTRDNKDLADQVNDENSKIWNGKVALITVSEYIRSNSNKSSCGTFYLLGGNYGNCEYSSWMANYKKSWFMLTIESNSPYSMVYYTDLSGIYSHNASEEMNIIPALYLSQDIKITGGTGTQADPYTIE